MSVPMPFRFALVVYFVAVSSFQPVHAQQASTIAASASRVAVSADHLFFDQNIRAAG